MTSPLDDRTPDDQRGARGRAPYDRVATIGRRTRWSGAIAVALGAALALAPSAGPAATVRADDGGAASAAATLPVDAAAVAALPAPAGVAWPAGPTGLGLGWGTTVLDTFEGPIWPDPARWLYVADLAQGGAAGGTRWSPSTCLARAGARSLRANGATPSGPPACSAPYAGPFTAAAILALDLSALGGATKAELAFDLWLDAEPNEGLLVSLLTPATEGAYDRRILRSVSGRVGNWVSGGLRVDLADARDVYDAAWRGDLRGRQALLEFVFVSADGSGVARGAFIDNLTFTALPPTAPTPPPGAVERTTACSGSRDCGSVSVFAYVDAGCDRRFRRGVDTPLATLARVDVVAGGDVLGARLSPGGRQTFLYPTNRSATLTLAVPDGYALCPNSPNPVALTPADFNRFRRASVEFRLQRP